MTTVLVETEEVGGLIQEIDQMLQNVCSILIRKNNKSKGMLKK